MILDSASLREILRVRSGHAVRHLANAVAVVAVGALTLLAPGQSGAQTLLDLQSQIESATQALQNSGGSNVDPSDGTADTSLDPEAGDRSEEADEDEDTKRRSATEEDADDQRLGLAGNPSSIERDYALRTGRAISQYGYRVFRQSQRAPITSGEISPDYVLGIGDELIVTYRGQISRTVSVQVNRDGDIVLPETPPIKAVGSTVADLRNRLQQVTGESMVGSRVFVTVGSVRLISISVLGEVFRPGLRPVNSFGTVVDAIGAAGGVLRSGSLRRIELVRANGERIPVDLYDYLIGAGGGATLPLQDGDRIVVPLLGPTVAVDGDVARPAIFETAPGRSSMAVSEAMKLAGGPLRPAGNRIMRIAFDSEGVQSVTSADARSGTLQRGEILQVFIDRNVVGGTIVVEGSVSTPGPRALDDKGSLKSLLSNLDLLSGSPYLPFAVIRTRDPSTLLPLFTPVDLVNVINGNQDMTLASGDRFIVLGAGDITFLSTPPVAEALANSGGACPALASLSSLVRKTRADSFLSARQFLVQGGTSTNAPGSVNCPPIFDQYPTLLPLLLENVTAVTGDVRKPGLYPIAQPVTLRMMLNAAGGLGRSADISQVEISRYDADVAATTTQIRRELLDLTRVSLDSIMVRPGDTVRVATRITTREQGLVSIRGEVLRPGAYDITRGERLSELLARAGGLTSEAYPFGAVFTRDRVRDLERQANRRTADELQKGIVSLLARQSQRSGSSSGMADAMGVMRDLVKDLATVEPYGRVVVEADPAVLAARPELDTVLEGGDAINIPKRPNYVLVVGEVLNPGAQQFRSGQRASDYVNLAGGYSLDSDEGRAFIVLPNGAAQPVDLGSWSTTEANVPPGSMIVIPRDLAPFDFLAVTTDVTRILSGLALTAASLNAIQD
ncbi:SLBB domain-containing protein [Tistrella mobilis]|uniref:polysaccharide biosynthesis/export family protein n=1 Tax=Tistrella mobilis TaxID=171437 RepID=UPI0035570C49